MKGYPLNPALRAAILDQLPHDLPAGNKAEKGARSDRRQRSVILGPRGLPVHIAGSETNTNKATPRPGVQFEMELIAPDQPLSIIGHGGALPAPGDTGEESISAQEEMRMACAWLMSLSEDDAAGALSVIRTLREGWTP